MGLFTWLFCRSGEYTDRGDRIQSAARKLSPAMPMAAAGAELDGENDRSETEEAIRRAAKNDRS